MLPSLAALLPGFHHSASVAMVGSTPVRFISADPARALLYVTNSANQQLNLWIGPADPGNDPPHWIVPADTTEKMSWQNDGPMATFSWYGAYPAGSNPVALIEVFWHPEQLVGV